MTADGGCRLGSFLRDEDEWRMRCNSLIPRRLRRRPRRHRHCQNIGIIARKHRQGRLHMVDSVQGPWSGSTSVCSESRYNSLVAIVDETRHRVQYHRVRQWCFTFTTTSDCVVQRGRVPHRILIGWYSDAGRVHIQRRCCSTVCFVQSTHFWRCRQVEHDKFL